jgi:hypothetical protein
MDGLAYIWCQNSKSMETMWIQKEAGKELRLPWKARITGAVWSDTDT